MYKISDNQNNSDTVDIIKPLCSPPPSPQHTHTEYSICYSKDSNTDPQIHMIMY